MFKRIDRSFATKLNFYLLFSLLLLWGACFLIFDRYATHSIEEQTYTRLDHSAAQTNLKVTRLLRTIEKIPENLSWLLPAYISEPDSLFSITRQVVAHNYEIFGCAIAFEPYFFPEKGRYFAPYSYMKGDSVITTQIGKKYDYYHKNWYRLSKELDISRWSRPYHELSSYEIITSTYSVPIHDPEGKVIGIFSVDLSLNWLTRLIDSVRPYDDSYTVIVNREGKYLLHSRNDSYFKQEQSILHTLSEIDDPSATDIVQRMLKGEKGKGSFHKNGIKYYLYYAPVEGTVWNMAMIFPYSHIREGLRRFHGIWIFFFLLFTLLLITASTLTIRKITHPLRLFASSARSIAEGNFRTPLPSIHSRDEMGELHHAFGEMQEKLEHYISNLEKTTAAKEKIESELRIAHDIQMDMLPKTFPPFPERKEIDLYAALYPARQVGGDLYDFFLRDHFLYFAIGDVSGKGIPASLRMASTIGLLRSLSAHYDSPARVIRSLNNSIAEGNETGVFVTFFTGMLDLQTGIMKYCNAGHTPPVLTYPDRKVAFLDTPPDIPLGILQDHDYREYTYRFASGSGILFYTDGVTDAENERHEFYGKTRLLETIRKNADLHPREFIETLLRDIRGYIQDQPLSDDLTLLTFIYGTEWEIQNSQEN